MLWQHVFKVYCANCMDPIQTQILGLGFNLLNQIFKGRALGSPIFNRLFFCLSSRMLFKDKRKCIFQNYCDYRSGVAVGRQSHRFRLRTEHSSSSGQQLVPYLKMPKSVVSAGKKISVISNPLLLRRITAGALSSPEAACSLRTQNYGITGLAKSSTARLRPRTS